MFRRITLSVAILLTAGCSSWRMATDPPSKVVPRQSGKTIQVITRNDTALVEAPYLANDSLMGRALPAHGHSAGRYAVALPDVLQIRVRHFSAGRSLVAVVAMAGAIALVAAVADADDPPPPPPPSTGNCSSGTCYFSCPLVYSWDGQRYRLDSGTFGGAVVRALQRSDLDNLDFARPVDGVVRLKVSNELNETDHLDAIHVLAVDHAPGVVVAPDAAGRAHSFLTPASAVSAVDFRGRDVLGRVSALDGSFWLSDPTGRDSARVADVRDGVELAFVRPAGADRAHLVVDANDTQWATILVGQWIAAHGAGTAAWYDSLNADPAKAMTDFAPLVREGFLTATVWDGATWKAAGLIWEAGPEVLKRQVVELDLRGIPDDTVKVRLESAPSLWRIDQVRMAYGDDEPISTHELPLLSARSSAGTDAQASLGMIDDHYLTLETGEFAELAFAAPAPPAGQMRAYLLRSTGWYHVNQENDPVVNVAMLNRLAREPLALSRIAVGKLNEAMATLREEAGR